MPGKTVKQWITIRGRHIPIFEGESKEDAIKRLKDGAKKGKNNRPSTQEHANKLADNEEKTREKHHKTRDEYAKDPKNMKKLEAAKKTRAEYDKAREAVDQDAGKRHINKVTFNGPKDMQFKGNKNTGKSLSFERREGLGLNPSEYKLSNGDGISPKSLNPNEGNPTNIKKLKDMSGRTSRSTDEIIVKSNYGDKEYIVTREHYKDTKTGYHRAEVVDIRQRVGNKEGSAVKAKPTEIKAASKPATAKPAVTEESIQKELSRTAARLESKGYNTPESIEKHIRELSSIRKNDLAKKMGIGGRGEEKIKAMVAKIHEQQQGGKKQETAKSSYDVEKELDLGTKFDNGNALKAHLKSHGYKVHPAQRDPEDRDFVSYPFTAPNGDEGYVDMVRARGGGWEVDDVTNVTAHERRQKEKEKSWQDKDAETKAKQIANAEKQKAAAQEAQKPKHYSNMDLEDEQFRKDALEEMRRYERNWDYYSAKEKREISPNGIKDLRSRIKEIEDYEKNSTIRKQAKELGLDPSMSIDQLKKAINTINNASPMTVSTAQRRDLEPKNGKLKKGNEQKKVLVQNHLKRISWNKAIGTEGQAETSKEPVKGIGIEKFCQIASQLDKEYDYDWTHDTSKFMGMVYNHYYIIRSKK